MVSAWETQDVRIVVGAGARSHFFIEAGLPPRHTFHFVGDDADTLSVPADDDTVCICVCGDTLHQPKSGDRLPALRFHVRDLISLFLEMILRASFNQPRMVCADVDRFAQWADLTTIIDFQMSMIYFYCMLKEAFLDFTVLFQPADEGGYTVVITSTARLYHGNDTLEEASYD